MKWHYYIDSIGFKDFKDFMNLMNFMNFMNFMDFMNFMNFCLAWADDLWYCWTKSLRKGA